MAAIETRRAAGARREAETLAIGEAIRELALDATPEEILDAVLADRARRVPTPRGRARRRVRLLLASAVLAICTAIGWTLIRASGPLPPPAMVQPMETANSGIAHTDLDGDGWTDIYISKGAQDSRIYRGEGDGLFIDVTAKPAR